MTKDVLKYLQPYAAVPIDMETTIALVNALKDAYAEQEPVAWGVDWGKAGDIPCVSIIKRLHGGGIEVVAVEYAPYSNAHPPQRTWVELAEEKIKEIWLKGKDHGDDWQDVLALARAFEAELKKVNT
jgi:hypothetical protein